LIFFGNRIKIIEIIRGEERRILASLREGVEIEGERESVCLRN